MGQTSLAKGKSAPSAGRRVRGGSARLVNRPLDRDFYQRHRPSVSLSWLPEDWKVFREQLREALPPAPTLTENDQERLFRAGCAVREASRLMEGPNDAAARASGLNLLLSGTFGELGAWAHTLTGTTFGDGLANRLRHYLVVELRSLREAYSSGEPSLVHARLDASARMVELGHAARPNRLQYAEAVLAGFLWWMVVTEWCWDHIRME